MIRSVHATIMAGVAILALAATPAMAKECLSKAEKNAVAMRVLQSDLMVGALRCGQHDQYNAVMQKFKPVLQNGSSTIRAYFQRSGKGEDALNRFMTELANNASTRSTRGGAYCGQMQKQFKEILGLSPTKFESYAGDLDVPGSTFLLACSQQASLAGE